MHNLGPFAGGDLAVDVDETLALGLENGDDEATVIDARDKFTHGHRVVAGQDHVLGPATGGGNGVDDALLHAALLTPEPIKARGEDGQ